MGKDWVLYSVTQLFYWTAMCLFCEVLSESAKCGF